jgi:hypothetical protein
MSSAENRKVLAYKVRNNKTDLYLASKGRWTKMGRVWPRKSDAVKAVNSLISRAPEKKFSKEVRTKDEVIDELTSIDIVELVEGRFYSVLFHADRIRR